MPPLEGIILTNDPVQPTPRRYRSKKKSRVWANSTPSVGDPELHVDGVSCTDPHSSNSSSKNSSAASTRSSTFTYRSDAADSIPECYKGLQDYLLYKHPHLNSPSPNFKKFNPTDGAHSSSIHTSRRSRKSNGLAVSCEVSPVKLHGRSITRSSNDNRS